MKTFHNLKGNKLSYVVEGYTDGTPCSLNNSHSSEDLTSSLEHLSICQDKSIIVKIFCKYTTNSKFPYKDLIAQTQKFTTEDGKQVWSKLEYTP
jgi:hypothetical protein